MDNKPGIVIKLTWITINAEKVLQEYLLKMLRWELRIDKVIK